LSSRKDGTSDPDQLKRSIERSFAAYRARQRNDLNWLNSRIQAATRYHQLQAPESEDELAEYEVASTLGLHFDVVAKLSAALEESPPPSDASVSVWRRWLFEWLRANPELFEKTFRPQTLNDLFGSSFEKLKGPDRCIFALPLLKALTRLWMMGRPLCDLESALGTNPEKLRTCNGARKFVVRIVPELAYFFGLPGLLRRRKAKTAEEAETISPALMQLGRCVRFGFDSHEMAALHSQFRNRLSRRQLHQQFALVKPYMLPAREGELWAQTLERVEAAATMELNNRR
jgi:hypothetical protein